MRFRFRSIPPAGAAAAGEIDAPDRGAAVARLQADGHYPLEVTADDDKAMVALSARAPELPRAASPSAALAIRHLASLTEAGVPLERALALTAELMPPKNLADQLNWLRAQVQRGLPLSAALAAANEPFGGLATAMVRAGEASGRLGASLAVAATWLEQSRDLRESVRAALIYPVILLGVSAAAVVMLLGFVVPRFQVMFRDMADRLPWMTRAVLAMADAAASYGPAIAGLAIAGAILVRFYLDRPAGRRIWHGALLDLPLIGALIRMREVERFSRALAALAGAGVALPEAAMLACATFANTALAAATANLAAALRQGTAPSDALARCRCFPDALPGLARVGEETGRLAAMLDQAAELFRRDLDARTKQLVTLLTPALTIGLGLLIAVIILSLLLPMLGLYETIL